MGERPLARAGTDTELGQLSAVEVARERVPERDEPAVLTHAGRLRPFGKHVEHDAFLDICERDTRARVRRHRKGSTGSLTRLDLSEAIAQRARLFAGQRNHALPRADF